jgi:glycosyltransferase involved in cell wall biosynthesis
MREILYLSFDSLKEGVGASQVLAYMRKVQPITQVTIVSFEKEMPTSTEKMEIEKNGLLWRPLPFGRFGLIGGISRVFRMWLKIDRTKTIHARSTLPALAALLRFPKSWIWDCRSLQADQRKALSLKPTSDFSFMVMRVIEHVLAKRATAIIVITREVVPVLISRYKISKNKIITIPTCVDVEKFKYKKHETSNRIKILFAGTFSSAYDLPLINKIISQLKESNPVTVTIAASKGATENWKQVDHDFMISVTHNEMAKLIQEHDLGFSIWRNDLGICLKSVASTKTAEFLACGKPVVINSLQGDFGALISEHGAGVVTDSGSEIAIDGYVNEIVSLVKDEAVALRCRELALKEFNLDIGVKRLIKLYESM